MILSPILFVSSGNHVLSSNLMANRFVLDAWRQADTSLICILVLSSWFLQTRYRTDEHIVALFCIKERRTNPYYTNCLSYNLANVTSMPRQKYVRIYSL